MIKEKILDKSKKIPRNFHICVETIPKRVTRLYYFEIYR